jgi:oligoendopeptidase F
MIHEGGHAAQSFLTIPLPLNLYRGLTSEIAELASMSMELISMDHWDIFFPEEAALKRAKSQHLEHIMDTLPWVATIDKFQHWLYENPNHSHVERTNAWNNIYKRFAAEVVDWNGLQDFKDNIWQKQLHIYEVPFYYVEYGMAQLGAIAVWKNYKENPEKGLKNYMDALSLGYSKSIKNVYATAGIKFDFSAAYIKELMDFVQLELNKCK